MYKYLLFVNEFSPDQEQEYIENLREKFDLTLDLMNDRTTILANNNFSVSIDKNISRVQIFDGSDFETIRKIKKHFNINT